MFAAKYLPEGEVPTVMLEFDRELRRMGFGNPYTNRVCDKDALESADGGYKKYKAGFNIGD